MESAEFQRIIVEGTLSRPSFLSGHTRDVQRPCKVYGLYCEKTGTIILESVWCDGELYSRNQIDADEAYTFHELLATHIIEAYS